MIEYRILNINELNIEEIRKFVSDKRIEKSERYKNESDRIRSIAVEYLLNEMIKELYPEIETPVTLEYDEHGKPHIYTGSGVNNECDFDVDNGLASNKGKADAVHFSLSHSGDYVACLLADKPCGIDIEEHSERDYSKIAKRICTENELIAIKGREEFYNIWTLKESVLKAVGLGLALEMREINIDYMQNNIGELLDSGMMESNNSYQVEITAKVHDTLYTGYVLNAPPGYSLSYVLSR